MSEYDALIKRLRHFGGYLVEAAGTPENAWCEAADAIQDLQRRLAEAEKDAGRYRWLRNEWYSGDKVFPISFTHKSGQKFDDYVDKAMERGVSVQHPAGVV